MPQQPITVDPSQVQSITVDPSEVTQADPKTVGGFIGNAISSTGQQFKNVGTALMHPYDTAKSLADIAAGGINLAFQKGTTNGDDEANYSPEAKESTAKARAFIAQIKDKYGSLDKAKNTLYNDPAGTAMDLSMLFSGGAGVAGKVGEAADAAKLADVANAARTVAGVAHKAAEYTNPVSLAVKPVAAIAGGVAKVAGRVSASKTTLLPEEIAAPLQAQADAAAERAAQVGESTRAEIAAAEANKNDVSDAEAERIEAAKAAGAQTVADSTARTTQAAQDLQTRFSAALDNEKFGAVDDLTRAAQGGDTHAAQVLDTMKQATTPSQIQQASIALQDYRTSQHATQLYDDVGDAVASHDLPDVPLDSTREVLGGLRSFIAKDLNPAQNKNVLRVIDGIRGQLDATRDETPAEAAARTAAPQSEETPPNATPEAPAAPVPVSAGPGEPARDTGNAEQQPAPGEYVRQNPQDPRTVVKLAGTKGTEYGARYEVRELDSLQPSHNGITFQPNPRYAYRNDRGYGPGSQDQAKVVTNAAGGEGGFDPRFHLTDNPDPSNGPPLIDEKGNVVGGNGRTMTLQRVAASNPEGLAAYNKMLRERAAGFGIDPATLDGMKQPVLVRVIDDTHLDNPAKAANAITDFNVGPTNALTPAEQAISDSRRVSQDTLDHIGEQLHALGPDATMAQILEGRGGIEVLNRLGADGVISSQDLAKLRLDNGEGLTPAGKDRISKLMVGRFFEDPAQLDGLPPDPRNKLERIAAPVVKTEGEGVYNLTPHVKAAIDLLEGKRLNGSFPENTAAAIDDYLKSKGLFFEARYNPEAVELAKQLTTAKPTALTAAVRGYAEDARYAGDYQGPGLMGDIPEPLTPRQAFNKAFGTSLPNQTVEEAASKVPEVPQGFREGFASQPAATEAPAQVSSQVATPATPAAPELQKVPNADTSYQNIRRLDSSLGEMIRAGHTGDGALIGNNGIQYLQQIRNAVRADLSQFAEASDIPDVVDAVKKADTYYKDVRVPFKQLDVARAATSADTDGIFQKFIKAGSPDRAQRYYDALDDKGRAAVRAEMATDVVNRATDNVTGDVDSRKLFDGMQKMEDPYGVFFRGQDKFEVDGLRNIAQQETLMSDAAKQAPPSGAPAIRAARTALRNTRADADARFAAAKTEAGRTAALAKAAREHAKAVAAKMNKYPLGTIAAAGTMGAEALSRVGFPGAAVASLGVGAVAGLMKALTSTEAGRRYLLTASSMQPGGAAITGLVKRLNTIMPKTAIAAQAGRFATAPHEATR